MSKAYAQVPNFSGYRQQCGLCTCMLPLGYSQSDGMFPQGPDEVSAGYDSGKLLSKALYSRAALQWKAATTDGGSSTDPQGGWKLLLNTDWGWNDSFNFRDSVWCGSGWYAVLQCNVRWYEVKSDAGNDTKLDFPSNSTCMNSTSTQITEDHVCIAFTYSRPASPLLLVAAS